MATSTGMTYVNKKVTVPGIGEVWYDLDQQTNLLSFGHMAERFEITHEAEDDTFNLQMKNNNIKFVNKNYLYTYIRSTQYMMTIQCMKKNQNNNNNNNNNKMKTRSHTTLSKHPMIGISNICLTLDDANDDNPFNQAGPTLSCFAGVTDSIEDPSDDDTDDNGNDDNDNNDDNYSFSK